MQDWQRLCNELMTTRLTEEDDTVSWRLEPSSEFSTGSLYEVIIKSLRLCELGVFGERGSRQKNKKVPLASAQEQDPQWGQSSQKTPIQGMGRACCAATTIIVITYIFYMHCSQKKLECNQGRQWMLLEPHRVRRISSNHSRNRGGVTRKQLG